MTVLSAGPAAALLLAVVAAVCFAVAAVLQHRGVDAVAEGSPTDRTLSWDGLRSLATRRGWLLGVAVAVAGVVLHASALVLAPLSVVQPVGVLAVPIAVLLTARHDHRRPSGAVWTGVGMTLAGVLAFVALTAGQAVTAPVRLGAVLIGVAGAAALVAVLAAVGTARRGWVRCLTFATAGAVAFGVVSALVRVVSLQIGSGAGVFAPGVVAAAVGAIAALLVGGSLVQQGYAAGPPEAVVACLTVVDPIVAIGLGVAALGEGAAIPPTSWAVLLVAAAAAAAGAVVLARHHPDAAARTTTPGPAARFPEPANSR